MQRQSEEYLRKPGKSLGHHRHNRRKLLALLSGFDFGDDLSSKAQDVLVRLLWARNNVRDGTDLSDEFFTRQCAELDYECAVFLVRVREDQHGHSFSVDPEFISHLAAQSTVVLIRIGSKIRRQVAILARHEQVPSSANQRIEVSFRFVDCSQLFGIETIVQIQGDNASLICFHEVCDVFRALKASHVGPLSGFRRDQSGHWHITAQTRGALREFALASGTGAGRSA
ncbi:hypothetical protein ATO6_12270 [Oceanicola sp. 22II-s10i]|nr:hypothetical protein ATO6_12270 [Oceanicola sp. 22II-s10i]